MSKFIQVECAVGWPDYTWSDGQYVYLTEDTPDEEIISKAVKEIEDDFNAQGIECAFIVHYSTNLDERFTKDGEPIEDDDEQTVMCKFCHQQVPMYSAHLHDGGYVGDECCWDERLRSSE